MPVHGADRLYIGDQLIVGGECDSWISERSYDFCWKTISEIKQSFDSYYSPSDGVFAADTNDWYYYMDSTNCLRRNTGDNRYKFSKLFLKDKIQFKKWDILTIISNHYVTRASRSWIMWVGIFMIENVSLQESDNDNYMFCQYKIASTSNSWYWWWWFGWYWWRTIWSNSSQIVPSAWNYTVTVIFNCLTWKASISIPWRVSWERNMIQDEIDIIKNWLWWKPRISFDNSGVFIKNLSITIS